jgi:hypothetical protein
LNILDVLKPIFRTVLPDLDLDLDALQKIKVVDADFEMDEETNTLYVQVTVDSKESLANLRSLAEQGLKILKEVNSNKDA